MAGLDLELTAQQTMLRDTVERLTAGDEQPGWADLAELGLAGLTISEACGGFGGGAPDVALVMALLGPALAGGAWLGHLAACAVLEGSADLATGRTRAALVCGPEMPVISADGRIDGTARLVAGGDNADLFVLASPDRLVAVDRAAPGLTVEPGRMHDGSAVADLHFAGTMAQPLPGDPAQVEALFRTGRCAEAVGLMQRMITDTADYLSQRRQFGAPIASFQALRHRLADMQLAALEAQALTEAAVMSQHGADIAAAAIAVRDAARIVGEGAVQLHGAMGLTEELRLGARFKRLLVIAAEVGSEAQLLQAFATADA